jgi:hypothetical protein
MEEKICSARVSIRSLDSASRRRMEVSPVTLWMSGLVREVRRRKRRGRRGRGGRREVGRYPWSRVGKAGQSQVVSSSLQTSSRIERQTWEGMREGANPAGSRRTIRSSDTAANDRISGS